MVEIYREISSGIHPSLLFIVVSGQIWDLQPIAMSNPSSPFSPVHTYKTSDGELPKEIFTG